jgi:membrane-associated protease RseP (regulator of RpoE activity)
MIDTPPATNQTNPEPVLRPEARVVRADRSLAAMVLFVCTLGGMGIGFGSAMYLMRAQWGMPGAYERCRVIAAADAPDTITWLGVGVRSIASREGTVVLRVFDGTAAERAGLAPGDVVRRFEGDAIRSADELVRAVRSRAPGDLVELTIERNGQPLTMHARLGSR